MGGRTIGSCPLFQSCLFRDSTIDKAPVDSEIIGQAYEWIILQFLRIVIVPRSTLEKFKSYMRQAPRTFNWGALLVYDRFKTNILLAQEHIDNLSSGIWIPKINFVKEINGVTTRVRDLQLDRPVLSFVNSHIGASRCRLSMRVISGSITELRRPPGSDQDQLVSYSQLDLLTAPTVYMDIFLNEAEDGKVEEDGRVIFDLSEGANYKFTVSSWLELNDKLGAAVADEFKCWDEKDKVWELNVLKPIVGELNPTLFRVRTHSYAEAQEITDATEDEKKEGAVIVGVAFGKNDAGQFPAKDSDMPYLLPSPDAATDPAYTMNLIYSNGTWLKDVLFELVKRIPSLINPKVERNHYGFYEGVAAELDLSIPAKEDMTYRKYDGFSVFSFKRPALNLTRSFEFHHSEDTLSFEWKVQTPSQRYAITFVHPDGDKVMRPNGTTTVSFKGGFKFKLASEADRLGELDMVFSPPEVECFTDFSGSEWSFYDDYAKIVAEDYLMAELRGKVDKLFAELESLSDMSIPFNLLRLNGILFRGTDVATPRTLLLPGDLSLLGDLSPKFTTFALDPIEPVVTAGAKGKMKFDLVPAPSGAVNWTVKPLKGESGDVGTIDKGVYLPPVADSISGAYKRVIVTATASGHTSSALVTVVPNSVSVYPYFLIANYHKPGALIPRYVLVGGDIDSELNWALDKGSKGTIREALPEGDDKDLDIPEGNVRIYVSPERQPGQAGEVAAYIHLDRVQVSSGGLAQWIDVIIPWSVASGRVNAKKAADGGLKLAIAFDNEETEAEEELTPEETKWAVLLGKGEIDPKTGIYQPGADEGPYIIVAGREDTTNKPYWGYSVLVLSADVKHAAAFAAAIQGD